MKRKSRKPFPNVRFIMREWLHEVRGLHVSNPNKSAMRDINRYYRRAQRELRES